MPTFTYQTLVPSPAAADAALSAYAKLFGQVQRKLFAAIAAGGDPGELKAHYCRQHRITARQFNAIHAEIRGKIDAIKERRKGLIEEQAARIKKAQAVVKQLSRGPKIKRGAAAESPAERQSRLARLHQKKRRLHGLQQRLTALKADQEQGIIRIAFGSRALFRAQFDLRANGYESHEHWRRAWRAARERQFLVLGSKDESGGCQGCVATVNEDESLDLRLRLPDALIEEQGEKQLILKGIRFAYGHENVLKALRSSRWVDAGDRRTREGVALSWRFIRELIDGTPKWYVHVSVAVAAPDIVTQREAGTVGVDFNADHLALAEIDRFGNLIDHERLDTHLAHKSADQREAILGDALKAVLARAIKAGKPIVVEKLDFRAKKAQLEDVAARRARILSALAYRQFYQLLKAACFRAGVELIEVSPAYTSVIGAINHAQILGLSVHLAAAFVIARRGLKLTEAPRASIVRDGAWVPTRNGDHVTFLLPVRNRRKHVWSQWSGARRRLCAAHEEHRRCGKGNLDPPPLSQLRPKRSSPASRATGGSG